ncbi:hypothetical protein DL763_001058 [Monosporascus cannonballus]|nr:hypothetical protein DL763_001058 [Monosporascus cannonballus]
MVKITEGTFTIGGDNLHTKTWEPEGAIKAKMIMVHGFSDHVDRYYGFFPYLAGRGIAVYGFDQRGWGRSVRRPADRGRTGPTATVLADMAAFIADRLAAAPADAPLFVLGHSMGGGQAMALASSPDPAPAALGARVRGWVLEAPFLGFAPELQPSRLTVAAGRIAARLAPGFQLVRPVPPVALSRAPEVVRSLAAAPLMHNTGTLEGMAGMLDRADRLAAGALRPGPGVRSLLLLHGTADKATSFDRAREWFDRQKQRIEDARFKAYEGMYHQLHADYGKEEFYEDVAAWILERADAKEAAAAAPESRL